MVTTDNQLKIKYDCTIILYIMFPFYTPLSAIPLCTLSPSSPSSHLHQSPMLSSAQGILAVKGEFFFATMDFFIPPNGNLASKKRDFHLQIKTINYV